MVIGLIKSYTDKPWRSPETYRLIEQSLRQRWQVESIATKDPEVLHRFLDSLGDGNGNQVFVFNIAEYLDEENKQHFLPELLEDWGYANLGSSAQANATGLDKARTKAILQQNQIATPSYFVAGPDTGDLQSLASEIGYPLIVKPLWEGGHIGIGEDSIVHDDQRLKEAVERVMERYDQPALVEEFITDEGMREFSVGILDGESKIYAPVEIDYESMDVPVEILSYEAAQNDLERIKLIEEETVLQEMIDLSQRAFDAVGASDYSRVDLRMNQRGSYVLEINVMPGLGPHSFLPEAIKDIHGLDYPQVIQKLAEDSISRQMQG